MKFRKNLGNRGFTLVELMIVIVIIGVLAALASFGFMEYVKKSKSAEADEFVKKLGDGAKVYFTKEQRYGGDEEAWHAAGSPGANDGPGMPVEGAEKTFPGGDALVVIWTQANPPSGGGKIIPDLSSTTDAPKIWKFLGMTSADPAYFRYGYESAGAGSAVQDSPGAALTGTGAEACIIAEANFDGKTGQAAGSCNAETGSTLNQILKKTVRAVNGDVQSLPAVLYNQGS